MTGRRAIQRFRAEYRFEPTRREIEAIHRLIWTGSRSAGG